MFHLFNDVFLESNRYLTSSKLHIHLAFDRNVAHPISAIVNTDCGEVDCYFDLVKKNFQDNEGLFWQDVLSKAEGGEFVIYADPKLYCYIQLKFWKSIFIKADPKRIYWLYNSYRENEKLVRIVRGSQRDRNISKVDDHYPYIGKEKFFEHFEAISPLDFFRNLDKGSLSFEKLLIQYSINPNSIYASFLLKRIEQLAWKRWFSNINSIKQHLLSSPQQIKFIAKSYVEKPELSILENISASPVLKWINDPEFMEENTDYIREYYSYTIFEELNINKDFMDKYKFFENDQWVEKPFRNFDQEMRSKLTYELKWEELLIFDINHGHGCYFLKGKDYFRNNHFLINDLYKFIRDGDLSRLEGLEFDQGAFIESNS